MRPVAIASFSPFAQAASRGSSCSTQTTDRSTLPAASEEFRMREPDSTSRLEVLCPDGTQPMGGGFFNQTPLGKDGEGAYSHSYERLGATNGFHDTATLVDPKQKAETHRVVLQVLCGR